MLRHDDTGDPPFRVGQFHEESQCFDKASEAAVTASHTAVRPADDDRNDECKRCVPHKGGVGKAFAGRVSTTSVIVAADAPMPRVVCEFFESPEQFQRARCAGKRCCGVPLDGPRWQASPLPRVFWRTRCMLIRTREDEVGSARPTAATTMMDDSVRDVDVDGDMHTALPTSCPGLCCLMFMSGMRCKSPTVDSLWAAKAADRLRVQSGAAWKLEGRPGRPCRALTLACRNPQLANGRGQSRFSAWSASGPRADDCLRDGVCWTAQQRAVPAAPAAPAAATAFARRTPASAQMQDAACPMCTQ